MTLTAVKAINCTSCGAGLDVLGGGRVTTHICPYCGTELDATDNYRALKRFNDTARPKTPFPIGTQGTIHGVDYTVIGLLEQVERWAGRTYAWLDHQLYSPTHGYAWLTLDQGHCTFSRRHRGSVWISKHQAARAEHRPVVWDAGEKFRYYETSTHEVHYAEGEFSWRPSRKDRTTTVSAMSDTRMLSFSATGTEREVEQTFFLSAEDIVKGFGFDPGLKPDWVHPLEPHKSGKNTGFQMYASIAYALVCLIVAGVIAGAPVRYVLPTLEAGRPDLPLEASLPGVKAGELVRVNLAGNGINTWSELELEVSDPDDELLFSTIRAVERYNGRDSEGSWSEGSNRARATFRAPFDGDYSLSVALDGDGDWRSSGGSSPTAWTSLRISATAGHKTWGWMIWAALLFGLMGGWPLWRAWRHNRLRWRGSDWEDDD